MAKPKVVRVVTAAYVVPWHLGNSLRRLVRDFDVTVVGQGVSSNKAEFPGVNWVDIDLERKFNPVADLLSLWALCRFLRHHKPDIVHSIMPKAGITSAVAGFICRVPIRLHTFTGQVWAHKPPLARSFLYWLDRLTNALNTVCLTDSPSQSQFLFERGITYRGGPLPVLGRGSLSGVDLNRFIRTRNDSDVEALRAKCGIGRTEFVFSYIARKSRDKGAIDMVLAFSKVSATAANVRLLFVGPDESNGELAKLKLSAPELFRNVIDIDRVPDHERYLSLSDVLCLPSYREGFGSIIIDAAAAAVPAIGSNIVGLVDSIEDGKTGILVTAGNRDELAGAMLSLWRDRERCKRMGAAARLRAESSFSADMLYAQLRDYYQALLDARPR